MMTPSVNAACSVAQKHSVHVYNEFSYCNSLDIGILSLMSLYNSQDFAIFYPYSLDYYQVPRCKDNSLSLGTLPQLGSHQWRSQAGAHCGTCPSN